MPMMLIGILQGLFVMQALNILIAQGAPMETTESPLNVTWTLTLLKNESEFEQLQNGSLLEDESSEKARFWLLPFLELLAPTPAPKATTVSTPTAATVSTGGAQVPIIIFNAPLTQPCNCNLPSAGSATQLVPVPVVPVPDKVATTTECEDEKEDDDTTTTPSTLTTPTTTTPKTTTTPETNPVKAPTKVPDKEIIKTFDPEILKLVLKQLTAMQQSSKASKRGFPKEKIQSSNNNVFIFNPLNNIDEGSDSMSTDEVTVDKIQAEINVSIEETDSISDLED